jgi:hypothetical protein
MDPICGETLKSMLMFLTMVVKERGDSWKRHTEKTGRLDRGLPLVFANSPDAGLPFEQRSLWQVLGASAGSLFAKLHKMSDLEEEKKTGLKDLMLSALAFIRTCDAINDPNRSLPPEIQPLQDGIELQLEEMKLVDSAKSRARCEHCAKTAPKTGKLNKCGRCQISWYCSTSCQKADWSEHKRHCVQAKSG